MNDKPTHYRSKKYGALYVVNQFPHLADDPSFEPVVIDPDAIKPFVPPEPEVLGAWAWDTSGTRWTREPRGALWWPDSPTATARRYADLDIVRVFTPDMVGDES